MSSVIKGRPRGSLQNLFPYSRSALLHDPEIKKVEETLHASHVRLDDVLRNYSFKEFAEAFLQETSIYETVKVDNALFAVKVAATVEKGAAYAGSRWREVVRVFDLPEPASKMEVPKSSEADYTVHRGHAAGANRFASGGKVDRIALDTTPADTIRYVFVQVNEDDVRSRNFSAVEAALEDAGGALAADTLKFIVDTGLEADAGQTGAGTGQDVLLSDTIKKMTRQGFKPDTFIATPQSVDKLRTYEKSTGGAMPFVDQTIWGGDTFRAGQIGRLWGMDVVEVNWSGVDTDVVSYLLVEKNKGAYIGLGEDIHVRGPEEDLLRGLTEAVVQIRYDYTLANANAIGKASNA